MEMSYFLGQCSGGGINVTLVGLNSHKKIDRFCTLFSTSKNLDGPIGPTGSAAPFPYIQQTNSIYLRTNGLQEAQYCPFMPN